MQHNKTLPAGFSFSQGSLQDYEDCPRRFQLRYIWELSWPAIETEPAQEYEHMVHRGAFFHHLVHQHLLGIPKERLEKMIVVFEERSGSEENELSRWWNNYLAWKVWEMGINIYPETSLSVPLKEFRLVAKYDLIICDGNDHVYIVDWKTSRKRPRPKVLTERLQSKIYPFIVVSAGEKLLMKELSPEKIEMIYWFPNFPDQPERMAYSSARFTHERASLSNLITEISRLPQDGFIQTSRIERCTYCSYRSFCNRGVQAGNYDGLEDIMEAESASDLLLNFDQIHEIEY